VTHLRGEDITREHDCRVDVAIVGSGPAGSTVAHDLTRRGLRVAVIEAGPWREPGDFPLDTFESMGRDYRDMGASVTVGSAPIPYVQAKLVGGASPINGAICWRMPRDVYDEWVARDRALAEGLPWEAIEAHTDAIEALLDVRDTDAEVRGRKAELMALGADALGLRHRPIRRNVTGCEGLGRCMQGCPKGRKNSVDRALLQPAIERGALLISSTEVAEVLVERGRAVGLRGKAAGGGRVTVRADRAVVLAASAVQTPALLLSNGLRGGPVGEHFQCHPGVSAAGRFREPVRMWEGATQGHEVTGLRHEGLKFETLGFGLGLLASRLPGTGRAFADRVAEMAHWLDWGVAVRAEAEGRVRVLGGRTVVFYSPTPRDIARFRRGVRVMGDMFFAAGAETVDAGVRGFSHDLRSPLELAPIERGGPTSAAAFTAAITHMFGTCRMGSDAEASVVGTDFAHHRIARLYIADSSVFPSNLGVNPQVSIMALAAIAAARVAGEGPRA